MGTLVVLYHSLSIPLRQGLSLDLGLAFSQLDWKPASPTILLSPPPLWSWGCRCAWDTRLITGYSIAANAPGHLSSFNCTLK